MVRKTASDFDPEVLRLFDKYDEAVAKVAWQRTVSFFNARLRVL